MEENIEGIISWESLEFRTECAMLSDESTITVAEIDLEYRAMIIFVLLPILLPTQFMM